MKGLTGVSLLAAAVLLGFVIGLKVQSRADQREVEKAYGNGREDGQISGFREGRQAGIAEGEAKGREQMAAQYRSHPELLFKEKFSVAEKAFEKHAAEIRERMNAALDGIGKAFAK